MGRMKEALAGPRGTAVLSRGGGGNWSDVSPRDRCPVCGRDSWCQVSPDGAVTLCKRVASDREKTNREGVTFFVHHLDGSAPVAPRAPATPRRERAPVEVRDAAYRAVLAALRLHEGDRAGLRARGLRDEDIDANGYRTLPIEGRACLARAITNAVGENVACGVPGVVWKTDASRGWWTLAGAPGIVVPVRDIEGRIAALKVRRRDRCEGARYLYVSSAKHGGPSAASVVHVPLGAAARRASVQRLVITEGELKADSATALLGAPVVSIPGVGSWASGVDLALAWGVRDVAVALDMDARINIRVARALRCIVDELRRDGFAVAVWVWDSRFKGLDDYLAAQAVGATHAT